MSSVNPTQRSRTPPATVVVRVLLGIVALLVLLILIAALLPDSVWKKILVHEISSSTGRQAAIDGNVELHLLRWNPELVVEGFRLANADWAKQKPMISVERFDATVSLWSLIKFHPVLPKIAIQGPDLDLERDAQGRANWDFSSPGAQQPQKQAASSPTHIPVIQNLSVTAGKLAAVDRIRKLQFEGVIEVHEVAQASKGTSEDKDPALRMRGAGSLNGKPFELRLGGGALINVDESKPYDLDATVSAADIKLVSHVTIPHPFDLATATSRFHVTGKDLADVYYLTGLALPNTPPYDVAGTVHRDNMKFSIEDFSGKLGTSDIEGKLAIDTGRARPKLSAKLTSKALNLADLAAPLGGQAGPDKKGDTLAQPKHPARGAAAAAAPPAKPALLLPDADLQIARVRGMDADVSFDAASIVTAKLPMKKVHFHLVLDNGKITVDPLEFTLPEGQFSGDFSIDAHGAVPITDIDMKLVNVDLSQFKPADGTPPPMDGQVVGRVKLRGSGSSVHKMAITAQGDITVVIPNGEMRAALPELTGINLDRGLGLLLAKDKQTTLRCGVVNFHAGDGNLKADPFVIDTTHVIVTAGGQVDLGSEAINMWLRGKPKEIRIVRVRSPIEIRGTLASPKFGLQASNIAEQAGGAVALGVLLTPVAALLAFVDPGLGKDADCAALLGHAEEGKGLPQLPATP